MLPNLSNQNNFEHLQKIVKHVQDLTEEKSSEEIINIFTNLHPANCALIIQFLKKSDRKNLLSLLDTKFNPEIFNFLDDIIKSEVITFWAKSHFSMLSKLEEEDAIDIVESLTPEQLKALLPAFNTKTRKSIEKTLSYPENSAGRFMDYNMISVPNDWNALKIQNYIKAAAKLPENLYTIYLINKDASISGQLPIKSFLQLDRNDLARDFSESIDITFNYLTEIDEVIYAFRSYNLTCAPVLDDSNKLIGIINVNTILELIHEKAEEDLLHSAGVEESDFYDNLTHTSYRRVRWLFISAMSSFAISIAIDNVIGSNLAGLFVVISSITGASSIQVITISINALLNRELGEINLKATVLKEIIVAILNSICFSLIIGLILLILKYDLMVITIFCIALILSMTTSAFIATTLPFILNKIQTDATLSSSSILNSITDAVSVIVLFLICKFLLQ